MGRSTSQKGSLSQIWPPSRIAESEFFGAWGFGFRALLWFRVCFGFRALFCFLTRFLGSTLLPFLFWGLLLKKNSRKKGTLIMEGATQEPS